MLTELKNRGTADVLMIVCAGLGNRERLAWLSLGCRPIRSGMCSVPRGRECDISNRQGVRGGGWK